MTGGSIRPGSLTFLFYAILLVADMGCGTAAPGPTDDGPAVSSLPPAYTRDKIVDPRLQEVARTFTAWVESQKAGQDRVFAHVAVIPPTATLLPYGIGTFQKETRLPAILVTGPGWPALEPAEREALAARAFQDLSDRLAAAQPDGPLRPSITIQTKEGLELAWINQLEPGGTYLHGERD